MCAFSLKLECIMLPILDSFVTESNMIGIPTLLITCMKNHTMIYNKEKLYLIYVGLITHVSNDLYLEYKQILSAETMHFSIYVSAESVQFA